MIMNASLPDIDDLWDFQDPAATEVKFRQLLPAAEKCDDPSYLGQLLTQIARSEGLQGKFDEADATLNRAEKLVAPDLRLLFTRCLLERGRVLNSSGKPEQARPLFEQAWKVGSTGGFDDYAIDAAHMIAIVESAPAAQLRWNEHALELAERSADERARRWRASLCNNIGWTYFDQKDYDNAMASFERAVKLREESGKPRELRIARYCVAKTLRMQGRIDDAIAMDRALIAEADAAGEPDGFLSEELGECLLALGRADEARPAFARAFAELSKHAWLTKTEPQRLARIQRLSQ